MARPDQPNPIPAYYCCYLLRSTVRHASLYIGSTPNPIRRLPQHNGVAKGGAKRTAREKLRPWEMVLLVEGFMNRVGALQFEWAWQHPEKSRHMVSDHAGTDPELQSKVHVDPKIGKTKPRAARSRKSLTAHVEDLHSLLRSPYFSPWPLRLRIFCADVHRVWRIWSERVDAQVPPNINIILDGDCPKAARDIPQGPEGASVGTIDKLSVDYTRLENYLEKSMFLLDDAEDLQCNVCKAPVIPDTQQILVCPQAHCYGTNHLLCLSTKFLRADESGPLVPTVGICPACRKVVQWPVMVQELSLRNRAEKEARAIIRKKEKRVRKEAASSEEKLSDSRSFPVDHTPKSQSRQAQDVKAILQDDPELDFNWCEVVDQESDSECQSRREIRSTQPPSIPEVVIEDSDWDDVEILE
ncbi:hypothetical protein NUU61_005836 [Penicillium alfredii]|uniref:GIY-YIG domain-containing protein n=1 Tax=Penicillium alfredii TaxID=1506179 RepID=A0A9W9K875_9EURO|nr:uncharacterized protein NUU61_005836 [Penicillium alfredii]KAJ5096480.1 hypothetical protein NUU61_005836 [Penicillium alfredii]